MRLVWKLVRAVVVATVFGAADFAAWKKFGRSAESLPASPYPSPGAKAEPMPADPVGPVDPVLVGSSLRVDEIDPGVTGVE